VIDLRSDGVTRPTPEMRQAMANAVVGDDVLGDDPTVNRLQAMAAERLGKEAGLLVPSGMMGNLLAVRLFARHGLSVVSEPRTHLTQCAILGVNGGNSVAVAGNKYGEMPLDALDVALAADAFGHPAVLLCLEDSFNGAGGTALAPAYIAAAADVAHQRGIPVHLDGARLFNAAVALGVDAAEIARPADTVMFCISKGLGSPVGSLLVGRRELIAEAAHQRHLCGGAMRQAGVLAACGIISLEKMVDRLAEDHANARLLAEGLAQIEGIDIDLDLVQTNLIYFDVRRLGVTGLAFEQALTKQGVQSFAVGPYTVRVVTHKDVSRADCVAALSVIRRIAAEMSK